MKMNTRWKSKEKLKTSFETMKRNSMETIWACEESIKEFEENHKETKGETFGKPKGEQLEKTIGKPKENHLGVIGNL